MNGIRDALKGDYNSGLARIADALVIAVSLAIGVAIGLFLSKGVIG
ncbi:threonine/serine exporter family protein [Globicatella sp. PHS-GS-PNBC-21-1553]|nr:threonine/serine exporter family protein [Globicatella sp. PHS-GS-PNBC-21-1553]